MVQGLPVIRVAVLTSGDFECNHDLLILHNGSRTPSDPSCSTDRAVGTGGGHAPPPHFFHQDENLEEPGQQQPGPVGM